jgi:hypothetical protein
MPCVSPTRCRGMLYYAIADTRLQSHVETHSKLVALGQYVTEVPVVTRVIEAAGSSVPLGCRKAAEVGNRAFRCF